MEEMSEKRYVPEIYQHSYDLPLQLMQEKLQIKK